MRKPRPNPDIGEPAPSPTDPDQPPDDVTRLLLDARQRPEALEQVLPVVYAELRRIAGRQMSRERAGHTLGATGLVHEAYLRLVDQTRVEWQDRAHFFGIAARLMRQILIDHARRRSSAKRGGGLERTDVDERHGEDSRLEELLVLDDALDRLEQVEPRLCRIVEYRYFAGLTEPEVAELLGVTPRTVQRDWRKARAWLYARLYPSAGATVP